MNTKTPPSTAAPADTPAQSSARDLDPIGQNIESILAFYLDEEQHITRSQRTLETISGSLGRPLYLGAIVLFVVLWILANVWLHQLGFATVDPPPFPWLQGIVGLGAFLTMIVVLIKQNRLAKLEERRTYLELQVNLLTEQKTTKLINLIEELRRDLPIKDRHDPEATAYQQPTDPKSVLAALDERLATGERAPDLTENKKKESE
ncbi:DUF1003 domain-containing protein [Undibacterium arcticum]|uniref:DUF1003 domain-containing protein n=1 Tax=Undibacterium arcticum TaxID=1762892 RepID=A0ABV7F6R4_9BURK